MPWAREYPSRVVLEEMVGIVGGITRNAVNHELDPYSAAYCAWRSGGIVLGSGIWVELHASWPMTSLSRHPGRLVICGQNRNTSSAVKAGGVLRMAVDPAGSL